MSRLVNWLTRLVGLQSLIESHVENCVRLNTVLASAVTQAESVKEAEQYAAELEKTHPQLATALRSRIAEIVGGSTTPALAFEETQPALLVDSPAKKLPGRQKKPAELSAAPVAPPTGGQ